MSFMVIPAWMVTAELAEVEAEASQIARPQYASLTVGDGDLEAVLRSLKRSGYAKVTFEKERPFFLQSAGVSGAD